VDNLATSLDSQEELMSFIQESYAVMASGGFELSVGNILTEVLWEMRLMCRVLFGTA
jgi:hypothetical protein